MTKFFAVPLLFGAVVLTLLWTALRVWGEDLVVRYIQPAEAFVASLAAPAPDYGDSASWAAFPGKRSAATLAPEGVPRRQHPAPVDVFYIHPTSYISGEGWNDPLRQDTRSWEMVDIILGAQASAFNLCCDIYAPHYRQATLWSFLDQDAQDGAAALELAYTDIVRAFRAFQARNGERPFVIASHSQGTYHALRLLSEHVDGKPLQQRMVAAYLIGYWVPMDTFGRNLKHIQPCSFAGDTHCVVHWSTYGEAGVRRQGVPHWYPGGAELSDGKELLCVNPLSWKQAGGRVAASAHPGALFVSPGGTVFNTLLNTPAGVQLETLPPLLENWTWAECRDGLLRVADQAGTVFAEASEGAVQDYHLVDYSLFYQSIRENALRRSQQHIAGLHNEQQIASRKALPAGKALLSEN